MWQAATPSDLLIGDVEAQAVQAGLPGTTGQVTGPLRRWRSPEPQNGNGAIVGVDQLDSGWALLLPIAQGLVTAVGTPMDPVVAAARIWHTPPTSGLLCTAIGTVVRPVLEPDRPFPQATADWPVSSPVGLQRLLASTELSPIRLQTERPRPTCSCRA